jgi:chromosome partitioning protein
VIGRDIRNMAAEAGLPILESEIEQRVAFAEGMTMGQTIFEWGPKNAAAREIENLRKEIERYVEENICIAAEAKTANR